jgi:hypothetical protein
LLLATNIEGNTVWHLAAEQFLADRALQKIWDLAKEILISQELLLAKNSEGKTAWHLVAESCLGQGALQKNGIWLNTF